MISIAPSILAADFSRLAVEVAEVDKAGVQRLHLDVMDGHFVPNLSMGPALVKSLRPCTRLPLEAHLMVEAPAQFVAAFLDSGADSIIVHQEVVPNPLPMMQEVRARGKKFGLAINPDTPVEMLEPWLAELDLILCMTVHPGFGGQRFLPTSPERIRRLKAMIDRLHPACELEVDGGIDHETAKLVLEAGANVLVAGTAIFRYPQGATEAIHTMQHLIKSFE